MPVGCTGFFTAASGFPAICGDGSWGVIHAFVNSANGCSVQAHRDLLSVCTTSGLVLTSQARCLSVP